MKKITRIFATIAIVGIVGACTVNNAPKFVTNNSSITISSGERQIGTNIRK